MADLHSGHAIGGWKTGYTGMHRLRRKVYERNPTRLIALNRGWEWPRGKHLREALHCYG